MSLRDSVSVAVPERDLERLVRLGRPGGRLHPDLRRHRLSAGDQLRDAAGDLRTLVGCGAGRHRGGLRGAAHRRVLRLRADHRTYAIATLTPVLVAALCGSLVAGVLIRAEPLVDVAHMQSDATGRR